MLTAFVCSPFGGKRKNQKLAARICELVGSWGIAPYAPHLIYPWFLKDEDASRTMAIRWGMEYLIRCDVLFYWAEEITAGMQQEINYANKLGMNILPIYRKDLL